MPKYDRNVIISLIPESLLEKKCLQKGIKTDVINIKFDSSGKMLELSNSDKLKLFQLTKNSRLYIDAHGVKDMPLIISNTNGEYLTVIDMAKLISDNVNHKTIGGLRISLNVCHAARLLNLTIPAPSTSASIIPTDNESIETVDATPSLNNRGNVNEVTQSTTIVIKASFAGLLQQALDALGIHNVDIVAHTELVSSFENSYTNRVYIFAMDEVTDTVFDKLRDNSKKSREELATLGPLAFVLMSNMLSLTDSLIMEHTIQMAKVSNMLKNEKVLLSWKDKSPIRLSSFKVTLWNSSTSHAFTKAGLTREAEAFNESRSHIDKLHFLRTLSSDQINDKSQQIASNSLRQTNNLKI